MKSIIKTIFLSAFAVMATTSCLNLEPKDQLADTNLWNVPSDFETFANQFYGWTPDFGSIVYDGSIHCDKRSDLMVDKGAMNVYSNGTNTVPTSDGDYGTAYKHIRRCNILLENAANYSNPADIRQSVGEARFFRAFTYFGLVQKYGDVIIVPTTIDVDDALMKSPRNDRGEVVDFIIEDLNVAAELLKSVSELEAGRVSKEAAQAFLGRVALYEGTWQKFRNNESRGKELLDIAAKASKEVMNSGKFSLYNPAVLGDSAQKYMFILEEAKCNPAGLTKNSNNEYIFSRRHDETIYPINKNITKECLANAQYITAKMAGMYLCQDGLPVEKSALFQGYDKVGSEWINRDNRMRYTLCRPGDNFWDNEKSRVSWTGDAADLGNASMKNFLPKNGTGYFGQKWATERNVTTNYESYDFPIIRYAEVLLTYAEAVYERDNAISDEDLNASLNLVRKRVNKEMPALTNSLVNNNGLNMREEIRRERTVEFFSEGFRIDDLKRWKTAEIEMPQDLLGIRWQGEWKTKWANPGLPLNADNQLIYETGRVWNEKHYLYPLPIDQLQLNPNLKQNPGWAGN